MLHTYTGVRLVGQFHTFCCVLDKAHKGGKAKTLKLARPPGLQHSSQKEAQATKQSDKDLVDLVARTAKHSDEEFIK